MAHGLWISLWAGSWLAACAAPVALDTDAGQRPSRDGGSPRDGGIALDAGDGGAPLAFQPGFHQALRWTEVATDLTTYRLRIPLGRAGSRIEVTFRSGDGDGGLSVSSANVASAAGDGEIGGPPVALTFDGQPGFTAGSGTLVTSDPVPFAARFHRDPYAEDVYVSFEALGNLAVSAVALFPQSYYEAGSHSLEPSLAGALPHPEAVGVATVYVEAPRTRVAIALGDSITEGYVESCVPWTPACGVPPDDYRNCWTYVAETLLGWPVVNAAVSGQGVERALDNLDQEVLAVQGVTDSVTLLGTNNLGGPSAQDIEAALSQIYQKLHPWRVYGATLLPKDPSDPDLAAIQAELTSIDGWLRGGSAPIDALVDFQSVLWASPSDPVDFAPGLGEDGIHPTVEGQLLMGQYAAQELRANP
ncbi:MAG: SGNH/GDSL hydrolase family protein [Myxococcales bacterium]